MKINKFKKVGKNKYEVFFDNTSLVIYEDIILKYDLLIIKEIDAKLLDDILRENKLYECYYICLKYVISSKKCLSDVINYLSNKGFSDECINFSIEKIKELNLLNDKDYIISFVNDKINLSLDGPNKIRKMLIDKSLDVNIINEYLDSFDEDVWNSRVDKIINKKVSLLKNKSKYYILNKIKNDLYILGYDNNIINNKLSNISINNNDSIKSEFIKAKKKYNDNNKIVNYLLRKGYLYEEIMNYVKNYK